MSRTGGRRERPTQHSGGGQAGRARPRPAGDSSRPGYGSGEDRICEIWGEPIFAKADAATAAIEGAIAKRVLAQEAVDDHQVRTSFPTVPDLVDDFAGKTRRIPEEAIPRLLATTGPVTMRERCRIRRLRVVLQARNE